MEIVWFILWSALVSLLYILAGAVVLWSIVSIFGLATAVTMVNAFKMAIVLVVLTLVASVH